MYSIGLIQNKAFGPFSNTYQVSYPTTNDYNTLFFLTWVKLVEKSYRKASQHSRWYAVGNVKWIPLTLLSSLCRLIFKQFSGADQVPKHTIGWAECYDEDTYPHLLTHYYVLRSRVHTGCKKIVCMPKCFLYKRLLSKWLETEAKI